MMADDERPAAANKPRRRRQYMGAERIFRVARTPAKWLDRPVEDRTLRAIYELAKWPPTAVNGNPARFVFVRSPEEKERLKPHLFPGNVEKTMTAPCCVIIGYDSRFIDLLPQLFPSRDYRANFVGKDALIEETAFRNATLQAGYFMLAARALGLDCGPMSGFYPETLDADFFPDGRWKSNFLCNVGYGSDEEVYPRNPRLSFEEACRIV